MKTTPTVGMRVHLFTTSGSYRPGAVTRVTPKGSFEVRLDTPDNALTDAVRVVRLTPNGKEVGGGHYGWQFDDCIFEAREQLMQNKQRLRAASNALNNVGANKQRTYWQWGKDSLKAQLDAIQAEVDEARKLIDAI